VDHNGSVTGLLTQDAVLAAMTGKRQGTDRRRQGQNR